MKRLLAALVAILFAAPSFAHELRQSYIFLRITEDRIEGRLDANLIDLNRALGLGLREDGTVTEAEFAAVSERIADYLFDRVTLSVDGEVLVMRPTERSLYDPGLAQFASMSFELEGLDATPPHLDVSFNVMFDTDPEHTGFLVIEHYWKAGKFNNEAIVSLTFAPDDRDKRLDLESFTIWTGIISLTKLGVHHIWIGIDHILFLLVLLAPAVLRRREGKWEPVESFGSALWQIVKIVTVFTIAHSITLSIAALGVFEPPARLIESVIALSIAIAALDVIVPVFHRRILWVVGGFGLFHGFGFANVLGEMGITGTNMALSLVGFNVGVELGQVAIVCAVFPLIFMMRLSKLYSRFFIQLCALLAIGVSLYWFIERAFEVDLPLGEYLGPIIRMLP